jgi:uncharacterized protein (DUF1684 family)
MELHIPYCVYDYSKWSCPIPPAENRLTVRIEAGEKKLRLDQNFEGAIDFHVFW